MHRKFHSIDRHKTKKIVIPNKGIRMHQLEERMQISVPEFQQIRCFFFFLWFVIAEEETEDI